MIGRCIISSWNSAYLALHKGKCIRRKKWPLGEYIGTSDNQLYWCLLNQFDQNLLEYKEMVTFEKICQILFDESLYNDWEIWE